MKILYLGDTNPTSTSRHRANALIRLGHNVVLQDARNAYSKRNANAFLGRLHYHTGYRLLQITISNWLKSVLKVQSGIDLIWVNGGEFFGPTCVQVLKSYGCPVLLYNNDDPTGGRDGHRFDSLVNAIPYYDLCVVMRELNVAEYYKLKAQHVLLVTMSYDEVVHKGLETADLIPEKYKSEVVFIGTWMPKENRDVFLKDLIDRGVPLSIWGDAWEKSKLWNQISKHHKGGALYGPDYLAALQGAKICIGLLSKGNRDLYTTRSMEIPYAGGVLCAERTTAHMAMYKEGVEAFFWSNATECATICKTVLNDTQLREQVRKNGYKRLLENQMGNEDICTKILKEIRSYEGE